MDFKKKSCGVPRKMQSSQQTSSPTLPVSLSFCILLYQEGRIDRLADCTVEDYITAVKEASIAWIDCSTKDDEKEFEQLALRAGFTKVPIPKLTHGFYSAYEDMIRN
jgi:magnesium transporter